MSKDVLVDAAKVTPAAGITGAHLAGIAIADWVSFFTLLYVICMLIVTAPKAYAQIREWVNKWLSKRDSQPLE